MTGIHAVCVFACLTHSLRRHTGSGGKDRVVRKILGTKVNGLFGKTC